MVSKGQQPILAINEATIKSSIKKVTRSAETADASTTATSTTKATTNEDSGSLYTEAEDTNTTRNPGEPVSEGAAEAGLQAMNNLYKIYYDYKKAELNYERGIRIDPMQLQRQMQQDYMNQQQQQMMTAALLSGITPLFRALNQLSKAGGSSGGGSSGNNNVAKLSKKEKEKANNNEISFQQPERQAPKARNTSEETRGETDLESDDNTVEILAAAEVAGETNNASS
jgi:hypothetical protein